MIFLLEIKEGYCTKDVSNLLIQWGVKFSTHNDNITADLTFDEVASLKDIAYCIHQGTK
jgi:hypothetical protein